MMIVISGHPAEGVSPLLPPPDGGILGPSIGGAVNHGLLLCEGERPDGEGERAEGERANGEGRPEVERPEIVRPEGDPPEKEKSDTEQQPIKDKPDREKEIIPAVTKKPSSKKTRPKSDNHQSPPSDKHSIQSGKSATKTNKNSHISRPKLKNIDRSTAQQLAITVGNVTVIITDFKEKTRSSSTSSSTITSSAGSEQQHQSSGSESMDKGSSRASTPKGDLSVGHDESF
ncbi:RING1 and YY1-binding protein B isoform X2 [Sebastes umbrosus]|uniref:RING1 and YY1-binding protein B isoform X2 n=1 Tax=Sebastes umbrosus TaxID=72105 RepID=UPI00189D8AC1|nr:RING1 and YY1-binding protein B isoform X2 [Sebastes umbrosus]